jgi:arylsulfatase
MAYSSDSKAQNVAASVERGLKRRDLLLSGSSLLAASAVAAAGYTGTADAQQSGQPAAVRAGKQPNIVVIMGDDVGWFNIGAYHRGMMSGKTPNLDKLASEGMIFTDYYAEASCTAGRAAFITGEIPLRTGLTTVGQAGAEVGIPAQACTIASALKAQGYATGQFGKNHLGDLNKYLPTVHGFDEFFGYLYHLDAMSDPYWYSFPRDRHSTPNTDLATSYTAGLPTMTTRRSCRAGARSANSASSMRVPLAPYPDMSKVPNMQEGLQKAKLRYDDVRRGTRREFEAFHRQGQD